MPSLSAGHESEFQPRIISHDADLLEQSYRLRYQVYCVERGFLDPGAYPDQREIDEFDDHSVHVGAIDGRGRLAATARIIKHNPGGFPLFRHCTLFPEVRTLGEPGTVAVEASRVAISRDYARRRRTEPFLTLIKAVMQAAKRAGATHILGATEASFQRFVVHYGIPFRTSGPVADYYGPVAPSILSLQELDDAIVSGRYATLEGFPVGWDPNQWPGQTGHAQVPSRSRATTTGEPALSQ